MNSIVVIEAELVFFLEHLFLGESEFKQLSDFVILHPQWLMSMMKIIMELTMANNETALTRSQIRTLLMDGLADMAVFKECWRKFLPVAESHITIDHICSIYCLIYPVPSKKKRQYIIPCKTEWIKVNIVLPNRIYNQEALYFDPCQGCGFMTFDPHT